MRVRGNSGVGFKLPREAPYSEPQSLVAGAVLCRGRDHMMKMLSGITIDTDAETHCRYLLSPILVQNGKEV